MKEKIRKLIKDFGKNLKDYVQYLMKVDFKELFVNTVILLCIVLLSTFVYMPISIIRDLISDLVKIFFTVPVIVTSIYTWVVSLISFILCLIAFMYLFNMRFADVLRAKEEKEGKKIIVKGDELELPKEKAKNGVVNKK